MLPLGTASDDLPALLETRFGALPARSAPSTTTWWWWRPPPVLATDDARVMAAGGGVLLVADPADSNPRRVREALGDLDVVGARLLGHGRAGRRRRGARPPLGHPRRQAGPAPRRGDPAGRPSAQPEPFISEDTVRSMILTSPQSDQFSM